ncbi:MULTISPECIES: enoyl-CoA hydratase/isomerase family protein [Gordonia]|uniref:Enoyl-CoA hydratase/isomerase family protein n=1 Tax=Gordonia amicalis TaxID=89053 RepID=A0AAE4R3E7_9ACTN|nr:MULTISPECIES: enoyl-CoA hydratase/isomerase family protein [Gordonia]ATD70999.1 enoyl-CoA hydratase/isomerase family protein [Gordonia sp. 1D]MCZ4579661.1 enoyl-CoA hydratase/isomerase family protein [Gordonia amicalis]MDJ0453094.1 enoyl-CoA hydratase/isomerase family protein [Gordonia amicalis]MDV6312474.1 enoyl-CoA hydratase/isomerase family protein [Gordonia amicalis]MDV7077435.1 enoyl-CoA hydratase/isomerase family protein [Gordonia amicalis]
MDVGSFETVEVTLSDHVLTITLNRPQALNSFNRAMLDEFTRLWALAATEDDVHVIVLRANGDRAFSTGVDVKEGYQLHENPFSRTDPGAHLSPKLNHCWKPLICAVHGMVAGGALYWLNEADVIIAADDAQFFDPHVSYGLVAALEPIGLVRRIPIGEVLRMTLLGLDERMSARRALEIGFVTEVLPREQLWDRAAQLAARIAAKPPVAIQGSVRAIWESLDSTRSHALATGLSYTDIGNPISTQQVTRSEVRHDGFDVR